MGNAVLLVAAGEPWYRDDMIGFAHPELLAMTALAPVLVWWLLRRRRRALRYSDLRLMDDLPQGRATRARWGGAMLRRLALVALAVAAANPRKPDLQTRLPAEGIAIVLALDVSGSMATPDFAPNPGGAAVSRLDAAKAAFRLFAVGGEAGDGVAFAGRPSDQMGLVVFAAVPHTPCPLTLNHTVLLAVLDEQKPRQGLDAGTNIGDAIAEGLIRLEAAGTRRKVLVLLSDGEHNVSREGAEAPLKPLQAAQLAANLKVPVYAIDCGGDPAKAAAPEEVKQRQDGRTVLDAVSRLTGGRFFAANDAAELQAVTRDIDQLVRTEAISFRYRRYHEYGVWFAVAGVVLLGLVELLERTRWRRIP